MLQTEIFSEYENIDKLQNEINEWLLNHPHTLVKDIKMSSSIAGVEYDAIRSITAMVIYENQQTSNN